MLHWTERWTHNLFSYKDLMRKQKWNYEGVQCDSIYSMYLYALLYLWMSDEILHCSTIIANNIIA